MKLRLLPNGKHQWLAAAGRLSLVLVTLMISPLFVTTMPGQSFKGKLPPLTEEQQHLTQRLKHHVRVLAEDIGQRNIWAPPSMTETVEYIERELSTLGYHVHQQSYMAMGVTSLNLEVEIPGTRKPKEIIVIGAHYDTVIHCPGANDNATGVAALLELARLLKKSNPDRTIRLVAFANEEPPFLANNSTGSAHYAQSARDQNQDIRGMLSLETMGYYNDQSNSQKYPFPFSRFYPDTANFIGFVGNLNSRNLVRRAITAFRNNTNFPSEGLAAPAFIAGVGWSDHRLFWDQGYQALMVTDTAFFRYDAYHTSEDTWEKLDYERLARVVNGLVPTVLSLASISSK